MARAVREMIKAEDFIKVWQKSTSITDVVEKLGGSNAKWRMRAKALRDRGIALRVFPAVRGGKRLDVDGLKKLAASFKTNGHKKNGKKR